MGRYQAIACQRYGRGMEKDGEIGSWGLFQRTRLVLRASGHQKHVMGEWYAPLRPAAASHSSRRTSRTAPTKN